MRINRYLARAGLGSRRSVESLIQAGRVAINGQVIRELGVRVTEQDQVSLDGQPVRMIAEQIYLALNKPEGYIVSHKVHPGQKSIYDLLPDIYKKCNYIGRLDQNSCGLLLFSNDGDFIQRFSHPSQKVQRLYALQIEAEVLEQDRIREIFLAGIQDDGDFLQAEEVTFPGASQRTGGGKLSMLMQVVLMSGRKRQLRRMCAACGLSVKRLERIALGGLHLADLQLEVGQIRELQEAELALLGWSIESQGSQRT